MYCALNGVTLSVIFMAYAMGTISQVFFITAGMFGGLAFFGTLTRKNLSGDEYGVSSLLIAVTSDKPSLNHVSQRAIGE